ncbi:MAG: hypothetical protein ABSA04_13300 [Desulfobaccales bacterium]|jgi:hypothetical protein
MNPESTREECVLRFYGHITWRRTWKAVCVDLDLAVERPTRDEAIQAIYEQTTAYIKAVLDTKDKESLSYLLPRPAPWKDRLFFQIIRIICWPEHIAKWLHCICLTKPFPISEHSYA